MDGRDLNPLLQDLACGFTRRCLWATWAFGGVLAIAALIDGRLDAGRWSWP
jgi:cytochrome c biogenesis factor